MILFATFEWRILTYSLNWEIAKVTILEKQYFCGKGPWIAFVFKII